MRVALKAALFFCLRYSQTYRYNIPYIAMRRQTISLRIFLLLESILLVILPLIVLFIYDAANTIEQVNYSQQQEVVEQIELISNRIYMTKDFTDELVMKDLELLESRFRESGGLIVSEELFTLTPRGMSVEPVQLRRVKLLSVPELQVQDVIEKMTDDLNAVFTLFQPFGDGIIRTSTSIKNADGALVTGTYIDKNSPVFKTVNKGNTFHGRAEILGSWYSTIYKPVLSESGELLYVLFAGRMEESYFEPLFEELASDTIAAEGYFYILTSTGKYILSPGNRQDGENVLHTEDEDGRQIFSGIIEQGRAQSGISTLKYNWKEDDDSGTRELITAFKYINELDWILGASDYTDRAELLIRANLRVQIFILLLALVAGIAASLALTSLIFKSIKNLRLSIDSIAGGSLKHLDVKKSVFREINELEVILESEMLPSLSGLISRIDDSSRQIVSMSDVLEFNIDNSLSSIKDVNDSSQRVGDESKKLNELMISSKESTETIVGALERFDNMVNEQSSSVTQISAAIEESNASLQNVSRVVQEKLGNAKTLELQGDAGKASVSEVNRLILQIDSDAALLNEINEIINEITEQSKLLAMNAAIEAAHAGSHGRGFAIVAGEMRALADNTAKNGLRIGETIKEILAGTKKASRQSDETFRVIDGIASDLRLFTDAFQEISYSTDEISSGTEQILSAANMLADMSVSTLSESRVIGESAQQLSEAVKTTAESSAKNQNETVILTGYLNQLTGVQNEMKSLGYLNTSTGEALSDSLSAFVYEQDADKEVSIVEMIRAHQLWVERVRKHLDGSEKIDIAELGDHHECALGRWLDNNSFEKREHQVLERLHRSHEELHRLVQEITADEQSQDSELLRKLEACSHEVIQVLLTLILN